MFMYVSLALVAITLLIVLVNLIKGLIRGLKKTIGSLVAIILSAIIAAIVTAVICNPQAPLIAEIIGYIKNRLSEVAIQEIFGIKELTESLSYYVAMIVAPFVFMALYIALSIIVAIIVGIVVKYIPPRKKPRAVIHRLGGLGVGVVCGLLVSALLLMPIVGVLDIVISVGNSDSLVFEDSGDDLGQLFKEVSREASEDDIFALYSGGTGWMFDSMASAQYKNGEKVLLRDEVDVIVAVLANIGSVSGDVSKLDSEQNAALAKAIDDIDDSPLLRNALAGVISNMASKWVAGEQFVGIERIDAGELLNPIINKVLEVLATSTDENVTNDLKTLVDILGVMAERKLLENADSVEGILEVLSSENGETSAIEELILVANENPRMTGLADEITRLSIRAIASTLGIPTDKEASYNTLMSDVAAVLKNSTTAPDREAYVNEKLINTFDEHGVQIGEDAASNITSALLADLGGSHKIEKTAVKEFFMMYAIASGDINNEAKGAYSSEFEVLSAGQATLAADPTTGEIMFGDYVFQHYNAYTYAETAAYQAGKARVDFGAANTLYSADAMVSTIITLEDILSAAKNFSELNKEEAQAEAKKFSEMLSMIGDTFGEDLSNIDYTSMIKNMGSVLDKMCEMQTLGDTVTAELVKAIFKSNAVKDSISIPASQLDQSAQDIIDSASREDSSYTSVTKAVGGMLDMIDKVNDKNVSKEDKIELTKELMNDMTPANAEMLSNMVTPDMMKDYVKDETKAKPLSDSVSSLFTNMSNFDTDDEEEYKKEAEAVNTMLNLAMESADSENTTMFTKRDENNNVTEQGKMDVDAEEFVALVANSKVVSQTFSDTVATGEENPYGLNPSEEDEAELTDALVNHYDSEKDELNETERNELKTTLSNIAILTNIQVPEFN